MNKKRFKAVAFGMRPGAVAKASHLVGGREDPTLMRREGLWLTSGGRVVKPGCGEYAKEDFGDILLIGQAEMEHGVRMAEFGRRWRQAVSKWRERERSIAKVRV